MSGPPAGAVVRAGRPDDAEAVAALAREFNDYLRSLGDDAPFAFNAAAFRRDGFGVNAAFGSLVADLGGTIVGYLLHHPAYDADAGRRILYIADFFVRPDRRRLGIGRALFEEAAAIARADGAAGLAWVVLEGNALAFEFYESIGARRMPKLVTMQRALDPPA